MNSSEKLRYLHSEYPGGRLRLKRACVKQLASDNSDFLVDALRRIAWSPLQAPRVSASNDEICRSQLQKLDLNE